MASEQEEVGPDGDGPTDRETIRDTERAVQENDGLFEKIVKLLRRKDCGCCKSGFGRAWIKETEHFTNTTTMHGPRRVFNGKECWIRILWALVFVIALGFLSLQICSILRKHFSYDTIGQISFKVSPDGMVFPAVTLCNLNPIQKTEINKLRRTGDLPYDVLEYLLQTNMDAMFHFSYLDRLKLAEVHEKAKVFMYNHPEFDIDNFLKTAGHDCEDLFPLCYFGGEQFDCCKYMEPVVTSIGKCYTLDLANRAPEWLQKQTSPGSGTGLQIIADANLEEEMNTDVPDQETMFFENFEHGFRYFVHHPEAHPELSSEGVSVGPAKVVYSTIKKSTTSLLDEDRKKLKGCMTGYPAHFNTTLTYYSAPACRYLCLAHHFTHLCGCSPFTFNIDGSKKTCLPHESVSCMDEYWLMGNSTSENGTHLELPECGECASECQGISYTTFNSYGNAFNKGSLGWLGKRIKKTEEHVRETVSIINIFYSEMFHTEYTLLSVTDWSKTLSSIGGNMGMFAGMSVITICEIFVFFFKTLTARFSKDRNDGLIQKADDDDDKARYLEEEVEKYQERKRRNSEPDESNIEEGPDRDDFDEPQNSLKSPQINNPPIHRAQIQKKFNSNSTISSRNQSIRQVSQRNTSSRQRNRPGASSRQGNLSIMSRRQGSLPSISRKSRKIKQQQL